MSELIRVEKGPYIFFVTKELAELPNGELLNLLARPGIVVAGGTLGGRGAISFTSIPTIGPIVIKEYYRGGFLGGILNNLHLRFTPNGRGKAEYNTLKFAREQGINVPEPLGYAEVGVYLYRTWSFMREVEGAVNLVELCKKDPSLITKIMPKLIEQIKKLFNCGIFHPDLHPGNVLVQPDGTVFLVDFDKALYWQGNLADLKRRFLNRWRRAVIKHSLSDLLSEQMAWGLKADYE
ncbi:MAG TPA: lipopolysaccharide kinase InaA family protein [Oligoflexia bacterium]|nr:lipopolysaccharide kinase InaA family protein [Oligoflexia bacterium]HMP27657.1 lipopolysaccharide kinase InaA family protein [Oligoflexia bacterium]